MGRQAEESGYHGATVTVLIITIRAKTKPGEYKPGDFGPGTVMLPNVKMVEPWWSCSLAKQGNLDSSLCELEPTNLSHPVYPSPNPAKLTPIPFTPILSVQPDLVFSLPPWDGFP